MELRILIRQNPIYNDQGQQIFYSGTSPYDLVTVTGTLPLDRQWSNYPGWIDVTDMVSDLNKLKLTWSLNVVDQQGIVIPNESDIKVSTTATLTFELDAFQLIRQWLTEDVSASNNSIEVKILDTSCGYYEGYVIKPNQLQWCSDGLCVFNINLKQNDEQLTCIKRTLISDNWQGWFPTNGVPANGKKHPRFGYCVEQRPNGTMIALWYMMGQILAPIAALLVILVVTIINPLIFALNGIIAALNLIPGVNLSYINFIAPSAIFNSFSIYFIETAGCGREHPAPLVRDYISNVCDKCGVEVDAASAPIFFATWMNIETSSRGLLYMQNPHYYACYFFPQARRGIRRFNSVNILGTSPQNTDQFWIEDNRPLLYLDMMLDQLKGYYNAEWRIKNGKLYFQRKDYYLSEAYLYDFTPGSPDVAKLVKGICYEPNDAKFPAAVKGMYTTDAADMNECGGSNGTGQANGVANFANNDNNPNFDGLLDKTYPFGAAKFRLDGASTDYIYDAMQQIANAAVINPVGILALWQLSTIASHLHNLDYSLLMQGEICSLPKILLWDGDAYLNAKCVRPKAAWDGIAPQPMPDVNMAYNTTPELWKVRHDPQTKVLGSGITLGSAPDGVYQVTNTFGAPIAEQPALLVNYPAYFEPYYLDTMWDWFHWIDDPKRNPHMNFDFTLQIELCCEDLNRLGVMQNAQGIALGQRVKLPWGFYQDGRVMEITVSYDDEDTYGKWIELSGTL